MDLPYPSQREEAFASKFNPNNRMRSLVLKSSQRNIPIGPDLSSKLRKEILNLIQEDYAW
jgi:hypothetical protein